MKQWIRQAHRWLSITFVVTVVGCFVAIAQEDPPAWVFYLPLPPLFFLAATGLYMFVLPYTRKRASAPAGEGA
jgi:membrane protein CcdC involved in cytochrome C biogenesis